MDIEHPVHPNDWHEYYDEQTQEFNENFPQVVQAMKLRIDAFRKVAHPDAN